ncbi:MAG: hypothetical protein DMF77_23895, partial [Acidobacteria bacterium]
MNQSRRTFLAGAGAAVSGGLLAASGRAATAEGPGKPTDQDMPRGMTFATIRSGGALGLAVKTGRGLFDVRKAESAFHENAPTTIDEVIQRGGGAQLQALLAKAMASTRKDLFID